MEHHAEAAAEKPATTETLSNSTALDPKKAAVAAAIARAKAKKAALQEKITQEKQDD